MEKRPFCCCGSADHFSIWEQVFSHHHSEFSSRPSDTGNDHFPSLKRKLTYEKKSSCVAALEPNCDILNCTICFVLMYSGWFSR